MKSLLATTATVALMCFAASSVNAATYTYVGKWRPMDGPRWTTNPLAYSGVGAAAMLFGGSASDYAISTIDENPLNIDFKAHYEMIGIGSFVFAHDFFRGTEGTTRYQDVYVFDVDIDTVSTFVDDFSNGNYNYAFKVAGVPEPQSWAMLIAGFGLVGATLRRRRMAALTA
jgi:PEP-CTERM motif